ncbi:MULTISPECIES: AAA family ATPase [Thermoanaerobacterium]|uniref:AAA family ATPase n=1 Tax=Thermoanaerobacterium TaxID=28895 RepID=UPI0013788034|nr:MULTISPECIES: AAA family ATPase [Thermoanaerobacterium]
MLNNNILSKIKKTDENNDINNKVITVLSSRSGIGTTFISLNLAYTISQYTIKPTLFIDLDYTRPDATLFFADEKHKGIDDLIPILSSLNSNSLNNDILSNYITNYKKLNFLFGSEIKDKSLFEGMSSKLINTAKSNYSYIIVDSGNIFDISLLSNSDFILIIVDQNVSVISETLDKLEFMSDDIKSKIYVIINKYSNDIVFKVKDIKALFEKFKLLATISNIGEEALNSMYNRNFFYGSKDKKYKTISNELEGVAKYLIENV